MNDFCKGVGCIEEDVLTTEWTSVWDRFVVEVEDLLDDVETPFLDKSSELRQWAALINEYEHNHNIVIQGQSLEDFMNAHPITDSESETD